MQNERRKVSYHFPSGNQHVIILNNNNLTFQIYEKKTMVFLWQENTLQETNF